MSVVDHALHALAYAALRVMPPNRAHAVVMRAGSLFRQRRSRDDVRRAAARLRRGTCLSRALAIAARAPDSEVVIGVHPPGAFEAHAWVELSGAPLLSSDPRGAEIVRLRRSP